jgi:hypothetical protein
LSNYNQIKIESIKAMVFEYEVLPFVVIAEDMTTLALCDETIGDFVGQSYHFKTKR